MSQIRIFVWRFHFATKAQVNSCLRWKRTEWETDITCCTTYYVIWRLGWKFFLNNLKRNSRKKITECISPAIPVVLPLLRLLLLPLLFTSWQFQIGHLKPTIREKHDRNKHFWLSVKLFTWKKSLLSRCFICEQGK
jgi:hypothetical protein